MQLSNITKPTLVRPRTETDADFVKEVHAIMLKQNYGLSDAWLNDPEIVEAKNENSDLQRFLISRNLRVKLGLSNFPTSVERFALEYSGNDAEWIGNINLYVVPALIKISKELN